MSNEEARKIIVLMIKHETHLYRKLGHCKGQLRRGTMSQETFDFIEKTVEAEVKRRAGL